MVTGSFQSIAARPFGIPGLWGRLGFLYLASIFLCAPFVLDVHLGRPTPSQWLFFQVAVFFGAMAYSGGRLVGLVGRSPRDGLRWWVLLYAITIGVTAALSEEWKRSAVAALQPLAGLGFYFLVFAYGWTRRDVGRLAGFLSVGAFLAAAVGIVQSLGFSALPYAEDELIAHIKVLSVFGHPNFAASFLGPVLLLLVFQGGWGERPSRPRWSIAVVVGGVAAIGLMAGFVFKDFGGWWVLAIAVVIGAAAWWAGWFRILTVVAIAVFIVLAGTRAIWIAVLLMTLVAVPGFVWIVGWRPRSWARTGIVVSVGIVALFCALCLTPLGGHLSRRATESTAVASRLYQFTIAVEMVKERPWRGWGYGAYATSDYFDSVVAFQGEEENEVFEPLLMMLKGEPPRYVHNDLLETAVDCGLVGVFALLGLGVAFLGVSWRAIRRASDRRDAALSLTLVAAIGCVAVDSLFGFPLRLPCSSMLFWGLLGIASRLAADGSESTVRRAGVA